MFEYKKMLQFPIKIKNPNPRLANIVITQYGGPHGELGASLRYLSQRFTMPKSSMRALLTDIGTEELAHMEIVGSMVRQLLNKPEYDDIAKDYAPNYVDHGLGVYPQSAGGQSFDAMSIQSMGDPIADIAEDMAADATP